MEAQRTLANPSAPCRKVLCTYRTFLPIVLLHLLLIIMIIIAELPHGSYANELRECQMDDFKYVYTDCEADQRWKVAVPKKADQCQGGISPPPQKGKNCSFTCSAGKYLNLKNQECVSCPGGTFSLGGGVRYEEFESGQLPKGFEIRNERISALETESGNKRPCPSDGGWRIKNGWLMYFPTPCWSILSYSAKLIKPGHLNYVYRSPGSDIYMNVDVQNEQCQSYRDKFDMMLQRDNNKESGNGGNDEGSQGRSWRSERVRLKTGHNVIKWKATNGLSQFRMKRRTRRNAAVDDTNDQQQQQGESDAMPLLISHIEITGLPYTMECAKCPRGTYSSSGSRDCTPCKANRFSLAGSDMCQQCPTDKYSEPRSYKCTERPPCKADDYYGFHEPCDSEKRTRSITYKWIQPKICRDDLTASVKLPASKTESCGQCNPGMAMTNNSNGVCQFCPKNHFSSGSGECQKCPSNTSPNNGYQFIQWDVLPPNMKTSCEMYSTDDEFHKCIDTDSWLVAGDRIHSAHSRRPGVILELTLTVPNGFRTHDGHRQGTAQNPLGHIDFLFSTRCKYTDCALYFAQEKIDEQRASPDVIATWNGTVSRKKAYRHSIVHSGPTRFVWAFVRSHITNQEGASSDGGSFIDEEVSIYSINVTNTQDGGASTCKPCPITGKEGCLPCPDGNYMDGSSHKCQQCPKGTMLNVTSDKIGKESCIKCGPNLHSKSGVTCEPDADFEFNVREKGRADSRQRVYNFKELMKFAFNPLPNKQKQTYHTVSGVKVYGHHGSGYFHEFNFTLSAQKQDRVICYDTYARIESGEDSDIENWGVESMVCRSTGVPLSEAEDGGKTDVKPEDKHNMSTLLGTRLVGISMEHELNGIKLTENQIDKDSEDALDDVHFYYTSESGPNVNCPNGHAAVVSLRCRPLSNETKARLPRPCPDGTCDGCLYHIILESPMACPLCADSDYTKINGECVNGFQTIHYIPAKHCVLSGKKSTTETATCVIFSPAVQLMVAVASGLAIVLCCLLIYMCKRNRKLEYKYMKLIEGKVGADGERELPAAESCALDEDEEDEEDDGQEDNRSDEVIFKRAGKKKGLLSWGVGGSKKRQKGGGGGGGNKRNPPNSTDNSKDSDNLVNVGGDDDEDEDGFDQMIVDNDDGRGDDQSAFGYRSLNQSS